jgi:transcriptional regulator with XRE-family HTH domain
MPPGQRAVPNLAGRQLSRRLKDLRVRAKMSQHEAGDKLWMDHGKISRIETGQIPEVALLREMLDLYGVVINDWEPMENLWLRAKEKGWWRDFGISNEGFVALEHDACLVLNFQVDLIPGLLQTEAYMRQVFAKATRTGHSKQWIDDQVAVRLRRAQRLFEDHDNPIELRAVIDEHCLRRKLSRKVMVEQLKQILDRSALPNATVQVVPDRGPHLGMTGSFVVLDYPDPAETGIAYIPHAVGAAHLNGVEEVQACRLNFEHIAKMALSPEDSRAFIQEVIAQL